MRIGMVLINDGGFPSDIRVSKEARALSQAGIDVHLLCKKQIGQDNYEFAENSIHVHRAQIQDPSGQSRLRKWWRQKVSRFISLQVPGEQWENTIDNFFKEVRPNVLHCHDLPALSLCVRVGERYGLPIVADLHENWPGFTITDIDQLPWLKRVLRKRLYFKWQALEKRLLFACHRVIVVVPEAANRIMNAYGIQEEKIVVVSNTEEEEFLSESSEKIILDLAGSWAATYVGGIGAHRGIDTAIRAAAIAGPKIKNFKLVVVGPSEVQILRLKGLVRDAGADKYVKIVPRVPSSLVSEYIRSSAVCLVPHNDTEHTNTTIPHKLFQYMLLEKPVLVSDCPPLKRVVEDAKCGLVFQRNNPSEMAQMFIKMATNPDKMKDWARNGRIAAFGPYAWRHDAERLVAMYGKINSVARPFESDV